LAFFKEPKGEYHRRLSGRIIVDGMSLDELDAAAGGSDEPWKQCKKYAASCRKYDKSFIMRCPMYTERGWD